MLIGLNGLKQVGKDTCADYLVQQYGFEKLSFAAKLKQAVAALFDLRIEDVERMKLQTEGNAVWVHAPGQYPRHFSMRHILQRMGTEVGREIFGENFWVDQVIPPAATTWHWNRKIVITDARFENELRRIHEHGGYNIQITRPGIVGGEHSSEVAPASQLIDLTIHNNYDLSYFYISIDDAMSRISQAEVAINGS